MIGRKGEKILRRVTLYDDETLDQQTGEVTRGDTRRRGFQQYGGGEGRKRPAGEGVSPTGGSRRVTQRVVAVSPKQSTPDSQDQQTTIRPVEDRLMELSRERVGEGGRSERETYTNSRERGGFGAALGGGGREETSCRGGRREGGEK